MAQAVVAAPPVNGAAALTAEELHEILECEKIVRFRDAVIAGTHPRIKFPPQLVGKINSARNISTTTVPSPQSNPPQVHDRNTSTIPGINTENPVGAYNTRITTQQRAVSGRPLAASPAMASSGKSEINPILLEKSDDLIRAEIQLQRQRLERNLREQVEQRRLALKAAQQTSESLPDFDLSDVLSKALTIVHPNITADTEANAEADQSVGAHTSASDSFDDNTFYSSQHDTPEKSSLSQEQREPGELLVPGDAFTHVVDHSPLSIHDESRDVVMSGNMFSTDVPPGLQELAARRDLTSHPPSSYVGFQNTDTPQLSTEAVTSHPGPYTNNDTLTGSGVSVDGTDQNVQGQARETLKRKLGDDEEPLIRKFALSPVAPQPARVSPLATARAPPVVDQLLIAEDAAPVAQVAALRKPASGSSPDSSPKESRSSDKTGGKKGKNGRKSQGDKPGIIDAPESPYIKPEPRSPSPFNVNPLPRPHKRQRQTLQQSQELNYDEPRYETFREDTRERMSHPRRREIRELRNHGAYNGNDDEQLYEPRESEPYRKLARDKHQYRRVVSHETYAAPRSPDVYALPYASHDHRPIRTASRMVIERPVRGSSRYLDEPYVPVRMADFAEPELESQHPLSQGRRSPLLMAPPRIPQSRIVVDEYGRQYYTASVPPSRQSAAPSLRQSDEDFLFERAAVRAAVQPTVDLYEEDGVVYRRPSPQYVPARRVITLPEHEVEPCGYRQREHSVRPLSMAPTSEDYVRIREPLQRRQMSHFEEPPREYSARLGSVRPERYDASQTYRRYQSVRPEPFGRDQAATVRPDHRPEITAQGVREYSIRPGETEILRREIPLGAGGYSTGQPVAKRVVEEVEYLGRPAQHVYDDDLQREVIYR